MCLYPELRLKSLDRLRQRIVEETPAVPVVGTVNEVSRLIGLSELSTTGHIRVRSSVFHGTTQRAASYSLVVLVKLYSHHVQSPSRPRLNKFVAQISPPHPHSMYVKRCYAGLLHDTPIAVSWVQNSCSSYCLDISHFHIFVDTTGPQPNETPFRLDDHCHLSYTVVQESSRRRCRARPQRGRACLDR